MKNGRLRLLTLFAGAGGADVGLRAAGFNAVACVDADPDCVQVLNKLGLPGLHARISTSNLEHTVGWAPSYRPDALLHVGVRLLWASPPCPPYSRAGARKGDRDPRSAWTATHHVIQATTPAWVIVENVLGAPVEQWASDLEGDGYTVSTRVLDATDYGLPQRRNREFVVAGPRPFQWPSPTHYSPTVPPLLRGNRERWKAMGDALPNLYTGDGYQGSDPGPFLTGGRAATEPERLGLPSPTVTTTEVKGTRAHGPKLTFNGGPDRASDAAFLATGRRRLSPEECAVLQGFSPGHPFTGTRESIYRQIGNAVPPALALALGFAVRES